jgi:predicted porin
LKLKIISLAAIAAAAGPAIAQSNLTVHGNLDVGLLGISNTSGGVGYIPSPVNRGSDRMVKDGGLGASNWGLRGTEDLGGGLRALFQIQGNLALDTGVVGGPNSSGTTSMWNQTAAVGVASDWGTIKFGRQVSPTYWAMAATDARAGRYFGSSLTALVGINSASGVFIGDNSNVAFGTVYNDNAILYTSPTWSHVTANVMYAMGETGGKTKANSQQAATAVYDNSRLKLSALFYNGYGNNLPAATALYTRQLGSVAAASAALTARGLTTHDHDEHQPPVLRGRALHVGRLHGQCLLHGRTQPVEDPGGAGGLDQPRHVVGGCGLAHLAVLQPDHRVLPHRRQHECRQQGDAVRDRA